MKVLCDTAWDNVSLRDVRKKVIVPVYLLDNKLEVSGLLSAFLILSTYVPWLGVGAHVGASVNA